MRQECWQTQQPCSEVVKGNGRPHHLHFVLRCALWLVILLIAFLQVSEIQARSAVLSWNPPVTTQNGEMHDVAPSAFAFEVAISNCGKNGKFKSVYV